MNTNYTTLAQRLYELRQDNIRMETERKLTRLTAGKRFILEDLLQCEGTAYPKQLSEHMGVSSARVAAILRRLESRGMIVREADPADSRQTIVSITEKGRAFAQERHNEVVGHLANILEHLGPEDAQEFVRLQQKFVDALAEEAEDLANAS